LISPRRKSVPLHKESRPLGPSAEPVDGRDRSGRRGADLPGPPRAGASGAGSRRCRRGRSRRSRPPERERTSGPCSASPIVVRRPSSSRPTSNSPENGLRWNQRTACHEQFHPAVRATAAVNPHIRQPRRKQAAGPTPPIIRFVTALGAMRPATRRPTREDLAGASVMQATRQGLCPREGVSSRAPCLEILLQQPDHIPTGP
jgi:hypothetical protein